MYSVKKENGFVMYNDAEESRNFKIPESNFMGLYTAGNPKAMLPEQIEKAVVFPFNGGERLSDIVKKKKASTASVIISDATRGVPTAKVAPFVVKELIDGGIDIKNIIFVVALGVHRNAEEEEMKEFFDNTDKAETYVDNMLEKKKRNAVCRRVRLMKKVNLHKFNYFVTFTYDDKLHTEQSFKKKLTNTLSHLSSRKGWRYIGVWERSPETDRLHFHGIFKIPGEIPGELAEVKSFSTTDKRMQTALESSYFRKEFGRNDFKEFENGAGVADAVKYLLKYLEKTGEKLVYSRNLPQYFLSDIMDEDIVCRIGIEKRKLLLYDDFGCWDDGCYMGKVHEDTIEKMPKAN